ASGGRGAGGPGEEEGEARADGLIDEPAEDIACRRADRDRGEKHREDASASFLGEIVGQQRRRDGSVRRFTDPDGGARRKKSDEVAREAAESRRQAPDSDADREQPRALAAVAERPKDR